MRGLRSVELGSGRGDVSLLLARYGADVTLVDRSETALAQARAIFTRYGLGAKFVKADLLHDRLDSNYDVSMSFGLLEHFACGEAGKVVEAHTAGALTFVSVPNALSFPYRVWKTWLETRKTWKYGFEHPYSKGELSRLLESHFTLVKIGVTPLMYHLKRAVGFPFIVPTPFDGVLGYALIAHGARK